MTSFYVSQGDPTLFTDEAITAGIGAPSRLPLKFGVFFFDYDLDGRLDLLHANGHLEEEIATVDPSQKYRQPTQLFWNAGDGSLVPVAEAALGDLAQPLVGRGAAYADLDGDGDLDVVVTQAGDRAVLLAQRPGARPSLAAREAARQRHHGAARRDRRRGRRSRAATAGCSAAPCRRRAAISRRSSCRSRSGWARPTASRRSTWPGPTEPRVA